MKEYTTNNQKKKKKKNKKKKNCLLKLPSAQLQTQTQ